MANWITQKEGIIDHSDRAAFKGTQPVRVLVHMIVASFQHTHLGFLREIMKLTEEGLLNKQLDMQYSEDPISMAATGGRGYRTPKIVNATRTIQLHETFLSYQWCICYSIYVLYLETIDYPLMNEIAGYQKYPVSSEKIAQAKTVFDYARQLIVFFDRWDKDELPNPEKYLAENRDYIEQTNIFFTESMKFILCHEFVHAKKHLPDLPDPSCDSCYKDMEYEADNEAIDLLLWGTPPEKRFIVDIGIVLGLLSMFYFDAETSGKKHPNLEDRLTNAIERLQISEKSEVWAFACIGIELWDGQFDQRFNWSGKGNISYREMYHRIVGQIKERSNK